VLVLSDHRDHDSSAFDSFDPRVERGGVLIQAPTEATHVWSNRARIALIRNRGGVRHEAQRIVGQLGRL
jgi:hypothetical protein